MGMAGIVRETGAPNKALVREANGIQPCTTIEVTLKPVSGKPDSYVFSKKDPAAAEFVAMVVSSGGNAWIPLSHSHQPRFAA